MAAICWTGEFLLEKQGFWSPQLLDISTSVEQKITEIDKAYVDFVSDAEKLSSIVQDTMASPYFDELLAEDFTLVIFDKDKIRSWSGKDAIPPSFLAKALKVGISFLRLNNGYYIIHKTEHKVNGEQVFALGLIKIRNNYRIENKYLVNDLNPIFQAPDHIKMVLTRSLESATVNDPSGQPLFFLVVDPFEFNKLPMRGKDLLDLLILTFGIAAVNAFALFLVYRFGAWYGVGFLAIMLIGIRGGMIWFQIPKEFYKLVLFDPKLYASSSLNASLGDLLLNIGAMFNVAYFVFAFAPFRRHQIRSTFGRTLVLMLGYLSIYGTSYLMGWIFNSLLLNSNIPFNLNNFMDLTQYSMLGLMGLSLVLLSFFMLSYRMVAYLDKLSDKAWLHAIFILPVAAVSIILLVTTESDLMPVFTVVWTVFFIYYLRNILVSKNDISSFAGLIVLMILFSVFASVHTYTYDQLKETEHKHSLAYKIADQRDRIVEYLFLDVQDRVFSDQFIKNYYLTPFISTNDVTRRIRTLYFDGYFNKYDLNIYMLDKLGQLIQSEDDYFFDMLDENAELSPPSDYLYFIPKQGGGYEYICNLPILYQNKLLGTIIIELTPKSYERSHLYPELLLEENVRSVDDNELFSYAVYIDSIMINKEGTYAYNYLYTFPEPTSGDYLVYDVDGLEHMVFKPSANKRVVITSKADTILQPITLFSYMFCVFILFSLVIGVMRIIAKLLTTNYNISDLFAITFRDKIQYSMIAILVFSFLVIGYATVLHFRSEYNLYHLDRLIRKENAIRSAIEYVVHGNEELLVRSDLDVDEDPNRLSLSSLSDIHSMDINIYDLEGHLINTSQPDIFDKGLQSHYIDPKAFEELAISKRSQYIQNETIGKLEYLSIYVPLRNSRSRLIAYMNLPYFAKEKELQGEISAFLVALVNVYVFLLVMGGFLAYVLSNSITASLSAISSKLKFTQLGRKNEPIEWKADDEIGQLVSEYNKMIVELEQSADLLTRTERESAWREMAKQIAHEIKNPLTPMKLSIQYLQRALAEGRPDATEMAKKVMATLIEQIENLTHIASEFSSFAKMPTAQNEVFELAEVVASVSDLFDQNKGVVIKFIKPLDPVWVYADKNQVLRVFNNLIKNAVQAIPSDKKGLVVININISKLHCIAAVSDNGVGISEELYEKVFVPNFTTKGSGTGLGLAISRQIVENAGGEIWFRSKVGEGTTFYVKLPLHKARR